MSASSGSWSCAMPDWEQRLALGRGLVPALPLDQAAVSRALTIFNRLRLPDVVGQPTLGEAAGDWFRDILAAVAGSLTDAGVRGIADVFLMVPKKNSKTTGAGAFMKTMTMLNRRPEARFGLFAPTQEIAEIAFRAVTGMIAADEELKKIFHVRDHLKEVIYRPTKASLKITTFDPAVATGGKFAGWLLDEAHLLGSVSYAARVIAQLRGARIAIPESFGIIITTQSDLPPAGAFKEELAHARAVRDGRVPVEGYLPVLYEFPEAIQTDPAKPWRDVKRWPMVLPNLGRSVNLEVLEREYAAARLKGDDAERLWASQHLNIEIGLALHANRWPGADHWEAAAIENVNSLDDFLDRVDCVTVGGDGGGLDDLLGLTLIGRERDSKRWLSWSRAWAYRGALKRRQSIAAKLQELHEAGELMIVDRLGDDVEDFADIVEACFQRGLLPEKSAIGLDPVGVAALIDALVLRNIPAEMIVGVPQGYRLSGAIKGAARKLADGSFVHAAQGLMNWCVGNAALTVKGNAELITKEVSGAGKIDPLMALFNAFDLMARNPEPANGPSIYEERGPVELEAEAFAVV